MWEWKKCKRKCKHVEPEGQGTWSQTMNHRQRPTDCLKEFQVSKIPGLNVINRKLIVPRFRARFRESVGTLNLIRPSLCLSVCPSVTKTLTLAITFALLQIELWYMACVFLVTRPFRWYHVVTLTVTFDLLQGQICCRAGDHNSLNF